MEELAVLLAVIFTLCCLFHPISLVLPKETGWSPKEKRFWAGTDAPTFRPRPPLPLAFGARVRPLRCPLRGRSQFGRSAPRERVKMPPEAAFLIELTGRVGVLGLARKSCTVHVYGSAETWDTQKPVGVGVLDDPDARPPRGTGPLVAAVGRIDHDAPLVRSSRGELRGTRPAGAGVPDARRACCRIPLPQAALAQKERALRRAPRFILRIRWLSFRAGRGPLSGRGR